MSGGQNHVTVDLRSQTRKFGYGPEWRHLALESSGAGNRFDFSAYLMISDKLLNLSGLYLSSKIISIFQGC